MIKTAAGNLLTDPSEALVNAVNCVGVMGKGIALQFKQAFPRMYKAYEQEAKAGRIVPGRMHIFERGPSGSHRFIINFPTKRHWRDSSRLNDIEDGLVDLIAQVERLGIRSLALPALGCGLGGLGWGTVRPRIVAAFTALPEVEVTLYE